MTLENAVVVAFGILLVDFFLATTSLSKNFVVLGAIDRKSRFGSLLLLEAPGTDSSGFCVHI